MKMERSLTGLVLLGGASLTDYYVATLSMGWSTQSSLKQTENESVVKKIWNFSKVFYTALRFGNFLVIFD